MIVGTAGHIDHGKTALVKALTGTDTDRLKDEKARGITIDLGFAYLPDLGFVDVPGHEKFIRNMLAGATGIDFVLLVVAADDGPMPQTREHLDIVHLLGLTRGAVALTKCDLVDADRQNAATAEIVQALHGTGLQSAHVFPVSARAGDGIAALRAHLTQAAETAPKPDNQGLFRMPIDRCFSLKGTGTVVTGAVASGIVRHGDQVIIGPHGLTARVRGLHAQNRPAEVGHTGQRCALNLAGDGVTAQAIARGDMVQAPDAHAPSRALDAVLTLLPSAPQPLAHWTPVRLHIGAAEAPARAALLQSDDIAPGDTGRVQLVLDHPIAAHIGDRFVIRDTGGTRTLGGGRLIDLTGPRRRRRRPQRLAQLDALSQANAADVLRALLAIPPCHVDLPAFVRDRALGAQQAQTLISKVDHVRLNDTVVVSPATWNSLAASAQTALQGFHRQHPHLPGASPAALSKALQPPMPAPVAKAALQKLAESGALVRQGGALRLPDHRLTLDHTDTKIWRRIQPLLSGAARFRPPQGRAMAADLDMPGLDIRRVLKAMAKRGTIFEVAPDRYFLHETLQEIAALLPGIAESAEGGWFPAAALRDALKNGRKLSIEILEHFDRIGLTTRRGDLRRIVPQRLAEFVAAAHMEEDRPRWGVRTSNPGGAVSQSQVGSTPTLFRQNRP